MKINYTQRWLALATIVLCMFAGTANAQVVFSEDFENAASGPGLPSGWTTFNVDARTPAANVSYITDAWINRSELVGGSDSAAHSTSWYSPTGAADDWMFTPAISVPANAILTWEGLAYDAAFADGYEVRIMTAAPTAGNISTSTVLQTIAAENDVWTLRTQSLAAYSGQTVYIGFRNTSNDKFVLAIDDVVVEVQLDNDLSVTTDLPNEYTIFHAPQGQSLALLGDVTNNGGAAQTNVTFTATVFNSLGANVYTATSTPIANLAPGATQAVSVPSFTPTVVEEYFVAYSVQSDQVEQVPADNVDTSETYSVDANLYSRDNGQVTGSLGIGAGTGYLGQEFDINVPSTALGVGLYVTEGIPGDRISVAVWDFAAGTPSVIVATTDTIVYPDDSARFYTFTFNPPLNLAAGKYAFTAIEFDSTMRLGTSTDIFTFGTTWVDFPNNPNGGWANNEDYNFNVTYVIRPIFCGNVTASITTSTNVACNGASTGSATAAGASGTAPYTYLWSNAANTATISGVPAGTYTVTATDALGCSGTTSVIITETTAIFLGAVPSVTNASCGVACDGEIFNVVVAGGTPPYTYLWSNGATTANISGLCAGAYTGTVTDANGCTFVSPPVTISAAGNLTLATAPTVTNATCNGGCDGTITGIAISGGTAPYSYAWSNGATTANITGLCAGNYDLTVTDNGGCTFTLPLAITITEPTALVIPTPTVTNISCNGLTDGTIAVAPTGGTGTYTYLWSPAGGSIPTASGLGAGTFTVTVTDVNGCTATESASVTEPTALGLNGFPTVTNVDCFGESTGTVTGLNPTGGTPPYTYLWSNGATTQDVTGLPAGTYNGTVTDANGCTLSSPTGFTVTQPATALSLSGFPTVTNVACFGESTGAVTGLNPTGGTPPYTYLWSNGATTQDITGLAAGTYNGTVTDANGCTLSSPTGFTVTQPAAALNLAGFPTATDVTCNGAADGAVSDLMPTGGTAPYTFLWSNGATTAGLTGLDAGTYNGTITDANGCTLSSPTGFTINEPDSLDVQGVVTDATAAGGDGAIDATVTGGTTPYAYDWDNGATTEDITGLDKDMYALTATDVNGCFKTTIFTVAGPVGISILDKEGAVNIYPNPASSDLSISITLPEVAPVTVKIFDMTGALVQEISGKALQNHNLLLDVSNWAAGVYNVTISSLNQTTTKRISVNH